MSSLLVFQQVTAGAKHQTIEQTPVGSVAAVVKLEIAFACAGFAAEFAAQECCVAHNGAKFMPQHKIHMAGHRVRPDASGASGGLKVPASGPCPARPA